ncbi:hypothetical protein BVC80_1309g7 [Macleaya cordata]|uniref:Uncharacterized protein n=1 Tax=Macleaya cordata TaxID=56857 RepID=A0A200R3A4_MACCD|nr:hypothetical protein BVC80_1309g7 [Macleaya cordata]
MAQVSIAKAAMMVVFVVVAISSINLGAVTAQDSELLAPSPAPSMDTGSAGLSLPVSGALLCSSLIFSVIAVILKQ